MYDEGIVKDMLVPLQDSIEVELVPSLKTTNIKKAELFALISQFLSAKGNPSYGLAFTVVY